MAAYLRAIDLPIASPEDRPDEDTVHALGTRKNELVLELIRKHAVEPYIDRRRDRCGSSCPLRRK